MWIRVTANLLFCVLVIVLITSCTARTEISNTNIDLTNIMKTYNSENPIDTDKELQRLNEQNKLAINQILETLEQSELDLSKLPTLMSVVRPLKEIDRNIAEFVNLTKNLENFIVQLEKEELKIETNNNNPAEQEKKEQINNDRHLVMQQFLKLRAEQTKAYETSSDLKNFISDIMVNTLAGSESFNHETFLSGGNGSSNTPGANSSLKYDLSNLSYGEISELAKNSNKNNNISKYVIYAETIQDDTNKNITQVEKILDIVEIFSANHIETSKLSLITFQQDIDDLEKSATEKLKIFLEAETKN